MMVAVLIDRIRKIRSWSFLAVSVFQYVYSVLSNSNIVQFCTFVFALGASSSYECLFVLKYNNELWQAKQEGK